MGTESMKKLGKGFCNGVVRCRDGGSGTWLKVRSVGTCREEGFGAEGGSMCFREELVSKFMKMKELSSKILEVRGVGGYRGSWQGLGGRGLG